MAVFTYPLSAQYRLELEVNESSFDVNANTSVVGYSLAIRRVGGSGYFQSGTSYWSVVIDGQTFGGSIGGYDFSSTPLLLLTLADTVVAHNDDGTKTIAVSGGFAEYQPNIGSGTASGSLALTTIPRASLPSFSAGSCDAGSPITISTNRASSSFTHTLRYSFGSLTNQLIASNVGASHAWTPPLSLLSQIPNAVSGTVTVIAETYNGGALVGTRSAQFTLTAGAAIVPDFVSISHSEAVSLVNTVVGGYVQNKTRLNLSINSPSGIYGSSVVSSESTISVAGQSITGLSGTTADAIGISGTVTISATVKDTRGRTRTRTTNITVLAYTQPVFNATPEFKRALSGGTIAEGGTYMNAKMNASVASLVVASVQKNAITLQVQSKLKGASSWVNKATLTPGGVNYNSSTTVGTYGASETHDVRAILSDALGSTLIVLDTLASVGVPMHVGGPGMGTGFGMYSQHERGTIDVFKSAYHDNGYLIRDGIFPNGLQTHYQDVLQYGMAAGLFGYLVIDTPLSNGDAAVVHIKGNVIDSAYGADIDLSVNLYKQASNNLITNTEAVNNGSKRINVWVRRTATEKVQIILQGNSNGFYYPNFTVSASVLSLSGASGKSYRDGWSVTNPGSLPAGADPVTIKFDGYTPAEIIDFVGANSIKAASMGRYTAGGVLTASYATYASCALTVARTGTNVKIDLAAMFANANSGAHRQVSFRLLRNGTQLWAWTGIASDYLAGMSPIDSWSMPNVLTAQSAGSYTYEFQALANAASAVALNTAQITAQEV